MPTLVRLSTRTNAPAELRMAHNQEITEWLTTADDAFFVLSEDTHKKFKVPYDEGEILIYSPRFNPKVYFDAEPMPTVWVAQADDFEFSVL